MDIKSYIEQATARLQAEVGRFLILKEAILKLPEGVRRSALLNTQNNLEADAMNLLSQASSLKEAASYKGIDILKMFDPERISQVKSLAVKSANTAAAIQAHKTAVAKATGDASLAPSTSWAVNVPTGVKVAVALGAVAFGVSWVKTAARKKFRRVR